VGECFSWYWPTRVVREKGRETVVRAKLLACFRLGSRSCGGGALGVRPARWCVVGRRVLVLLVLVVQVGERRLGLLELGVVHALAVVPVDERAAPVHVGELCAHAPQRPVGDRRRVADERGAHAQSARRDVAHRRLSR